MSSRKSVVVLFLLLVAGLGGSTLRGAVAFAQAQPNASREVVLLYTNDFHSALDPIQAYWLKGQPQIGGAAAVAGYVNRLRAQHETTFLFDSGDMFTGLVSNVTRGEALMEMMRVMKYDAMAIGNHEFDYGSANFERQMNRLPMPVLGANIFYKGTRHRYSRPYVILERNGLRLGVIGIIGQDARSVALPEGITDLDFDDPAPAIAPLVAELKPQVDLVVVLAHQGKTGPQQTDAEAHPDLQRDFDEDIKLAGDVPGIDVLIGGHAHRGIEQPYVHPRTGTIIVQTYGYGTRLGVLRLQVGGSRVIAHEGELLPTWTNGVAPDAAVASVVQRYERQVAAKEGAPIVTLARRVYRAYNAESPLGNLVADALKDATGADIALQNAGGLRADLPEGAITSGSVLDVLPFLNTVDVYTLTGAQIVELLEQSLTLERGMMQVAGLRIEYDLSHPAGQRLARAFVGTAPLAANATYTVATNSFLGQGGDLYTTFLHATRTSVGDPISEVVSRYLRRIGADAAVPPVPFVAERLRPATP